MATQAWFSPSHHKAHLLVADSFVPRTFRFRHALTRDAVLAELLPAERAELCRRALEAIERSQPGLPGDLCELAATLAEKAGDPARSAQLLLEAGRRACSRGALATAEGVLDRAWTLGRGEPAVRAEIDHALLEVTSLAGKTDRAFEVGERLLAPERPAEERAIVHVRLARAAAVASRWEPAAAHLESARRVAADTADEALGAVVDAVTVHVALGQDHPAEAATLARAALAVAERVDLPEVACEALEVIGRCARWRDQDEAAAAFDRACQVAERNDLPAWRLRAVLERATLDLSAGPCDRLIAAREEAAGAGALAAAATLDLQLAVWHKDRFAPDRVMEAATRCAEVARRFRLNALLGALVAQACAHAQRSERDPMEAKIAEALAVAPGDPEVLAIAWETRAILSLLREDRARALAELDTSMEHLRVSPRLPLPARGLWALLRTLEGPDGDAAYREVDAAGFAGHRIIQGYLGHAAAVSLGRGGRSDEASTAFTVADQTLAPFEWIRSHARRLVAGAALSDGWGCPAVWLREALCFFEGRGDQRIASACRSLLGKTGAPVPRQRQASGVPASLRAMGVTGRELEVLVLLAEGRPTKEIAARLYLSPKTVERHIENLEAKTGVAGRAELVAFAATWAASTQHGAAR